MEDKEHLSVLQAEDISKEPAASHDGSDNESRDFVSNLVDRLCENCKKVREQIIMKGKCTSMSQEDSDGEEKGPWPLIPGAELGLLENLHRRSRKALKEGQEELTVAFKNMEHDVQDAAKQATKCIRCVIRKGWNVVSHWELPEWLRDNEFLSHGHRPQLPSFRQCFGSIFRVHTETGNIWTHLVGFILFVLAMLAVFARPHVSLAFEYPNGWIEYIVFGAFFTGAILCLLFSWLFHTVYCHSEKVHSIFSKLDYSGIAFLIMGSYVPCLYYGFYCKKNTQIAYLVTMSVFGVTCIIVSLWDKFGTPKFRPLRAGLFLCLGCSGFVPSIHLIFAHGFLKGVQQGALGWLLLMGALYITGALLYAFRVPERFFPGKCNIWFQSHQIFHVLVVIAAFIHLYGICEMAFYRLKVGRSCPRV